MGRQRDAIGAGILTLWQAATDLDKPLEGSLRNEQQRPEKEHRIRKSGQIADGTIFPGRPA